MWSRASHVPKNNTTAETFFLQCQLKVMSLFRVRQIFPKKPNPIFALVLVPSSEITGCKHVQTGTNIFIKNDFPVPLYQKTEKKKKKTFEGKIRHFQTVYSFVERYFFVRAIRYPVTPHFCLHLWYPTQLPAQDCIKIQLLYKKEDTNCA